VRAVRVSRATGPLELVEQPIPEPGGLAVGGKLVIVGSPADPLEVPIFGLMMARQSIVGWPSGSSIDSQDTLAFSALSGVRPIRRSFRWSAPPKATST
jgi:D-arabinose 1-dehydrogenase-like Zn-dependent alcohol dehydrogenase